MCLDNQPEARLGRDGVSACVPLKRTEALRHRPRALMKGDGQDRRRGSQRDVLLRDSASRIARRSEHSNVRRHKEHPAKTFTVGVLYIVDRKETTGAQSVGAVAEQDGDRDRRSFAALEGYKREPGTDAITYHIPSPPLAPISRKCKRSAYRKNTPKYLRMRCLTSLTASSELGLRRWISCIEP